MANSRTQDCRYPSKFSGKAERMVTAAQYLAELLCDRQAKQQKRGLPQEFWKTKEWKPVFMQQLLAINRLLDRLDPKLDTEGKPDKKKGKRNGSGEKALSRFLRSERGKKIYSLSAPWIVPLVDAAHRNVLVQQEDAALPQPEDKPLEPYVTEPPRPTFARGLSVMAKLRKLDNV